MVIMESRWKAMFTFLFLVISVTSPLFQTASAGGGQGVITTFADGSNTFQVNLNGSQFESSATLQLERNTTIMDATFEISYDSISPSPGQVYVDISEDNSYEWAWDGLGYGKVGNQTTFSDGTSVNTTEIDSTGSILGATLLPASAQIQGYDLTVEFSPDFGGGFFATGVIDSMEMGDTDADNLPEPVFLQRSHTWTNGTTSPAIGTLDWSSTTGFSTVSWEPVCDGAGDIVVGDFSGDSRADVASFDNTNATVCLLMSNSTGGWTQHANLSLGISATAIDAGDLDGDGDDELVAVFGDGTLKQYTYNQTNTSFDLGASITIMSNGTPMQALLGSVAVGKFWGSGNDTVVVADSMDGHVTMWNLTQGSWLQGNPGSSFDCIKSSLTHADWNGDGLLDLIGGTDTGICTATFNGTGWSIQETNGTQLNNFIVGDWNNNGSVDVLQPLQGTPDGNDSTFTGHVEVRQFGPNGSVASSYLNLQPHTAPSDMEMADMDGDGVMEHIFVAGESSVGLYIAGWHSATFDGDGDNQAEAQLIGYAGDGLNGVNPLEWQDMGNMSSTLAQNFMQLQPMSDPYGNQITTVMAYGVSTGEGDMTMKDLNVVYDATFVVSTNPITSNLTNQLNSLMQPGTGNINVSIPLNSTQSGTLVLESVMVQWTAGMSSQVFRNAPVFNDASVFWNPIQNTHVVVLNWTADAMQEADFLGYQLYRWENGSTPQLNVPHEVSPMNSSIDMTNVNGKVWDYVVRTQYDNGVYSNYSDLITVNVPGAQAQDVVPPAAPANMIASDKPGDEGGWVQLVWLPSISNDVLWHAVYYSESAFTNASEATEIDNFTTMENINSMDWQTPEDGVDYYFGVIAGDLAGNVNWTAATAGPVQSKNNSMRGVTMSTSLEAGSIEGMTQIAGSGSAFQLTGSLISEGVSLPGETVTANFDPELGTGTTLSAITDSEGNFSFIFADWNNLLTQESVSMAGVVDLTISFTGGTYGPDSQDLASVTDELEFEVHIAASLSLNPSTIQLDESGAGTVTVSLTTDNVAEQSMVDGLSASYVVGNETNQATADSGSVNFDSSGIAPIQISNIQGGELDVDIVSPPDWLMVTGSPARTILLPPPLIEEPEENETEEEWFELEPLELDCDITGWTVTENASDSEAGCTLTNPNSVMVHADISVSAPQGLDLSYSPTSASLFSDESIQIELTLGAPLGHEAGNYSLTFTIEASASGYNSSSLSPELPFEVLAEVLETVDSDDGNQGENSGGPSTPPASNDNQGLSPAMIGGIAAVALALLGGGFFVMRAMSRGKDDDDDDWLDEYDEDYDEDYDDTPTAMVGAKLQSDSKPRRGSFVSRPGDSKSLAGRPKERPSERGRPVPVEQTWEEESYEEEYDDYDDYTQSEDYHMDDDGVEWWKDEVGVWWYRYPDEEEWSEYIE